MKHFIVVVLALLLAFAIINGAQQVSAGNNTLITLLQRQMAEQQKHSSYVVRVYEPIGRVSVVDGRLSEIGSDYFCVLHDYGSVECWPFSQVASVEFIGK